MNTGLSIQQVSSITGLSIDTLRYYERLGLLAYTRISRLPNGHRRYSDLDLEWIDFVKCLRSTAMPIAEMQHFAEITRQGDSTVKERLQLLESHRRKVLLELQAMQQTLAHIDAKIVQYRLLASEQSAPSVESEQSSRKKGNIMAKTWFITGASSGFGHEWTQAALERGDRVAATARNVGSLNSLAEKYGDAVLPLRLDVTNRSNVFETVQRAAEHFGSLDVVINSAGYGQFGMVEELSEDDIRAQLETNFFGALWVTQAALPIMRKQHSGRILQVTSEGGVRAWPGIGAYHASKWALEGLSQSLSQEVKQFGIHVTVVEPGPYATGFAASHRNSKENPDYKIVRDGIDYNWQFGILSATRRAILKVVDAEQPPLRILLGKSLEPLTAEYEQRLATWNKWQSVSLEAFGA